MAVLGGYSRRVQGSSEAVARSIRSDRHAHQFHSRTGRVGRDSLLYRNIARSQGRCILYLCRGRECRLHLHSQPERLPAESLEGEGNPAGPHRIIDAAEGRFKPANALTRSVPLSFPPKSHGLPPLDGSSMETTFDYLRQFGPLLAEAHSRNLSTTSEHERPRCPALRNLLARRSRPGARHHRYREISAQGKGCADRRRVRRGQNLHGFGHNPCSGGGTAQYDAGDVPSHITHKWAREVLLTIPRARAFLIEDMRNGGDPVGRMASAR